MKYLPFIFVTLLILLLVTAVGFAQPTLPMSPSQAPIDGGLGLLAAAGGAYAYKKLKNKNTDKADVDL